MPNDDWMLWKPPRTKAPAAPESKPREILWTLVRTSEHIRAELIVHTAVGIEVQLVRNGTFFAGRMFRSRSAAEKHATTTKDALLVGGWR